MGQLSAVLGKGRERQAAGFVTGIDQVDVGEEDSRLSGQLGREASAIGLSILLFLNENPVATRGTPTPCPVGIAWITFLVPV